MKLLALIASLATMQAQITQERLVNATKEPGNWLTYHGSYASNHHSTLNQVTPANAKNLELKWVFQAQSLEKFEATPLIVDGVMYLTEAPNTVIALDAATGREFWVYEHKNPDVTYPCCGKVNRGLGILGNTLFMGTTVTTRALRSGQFNIGNAESAIPLIGTQLKIGLIPLGVLVLTSLAVLGWLRFRDTKLAGGKGVALDAKS